MNITNRSRLFNSYSKVYILRNVVIINGLQLSEKVIKFNQVLINNINKLIPNLEVLISTEIETLFCHHRYIDVIYQGISYNLDLINKYAKQNQVNINFIYREKDNFYWKYANSGFYKFKTFFYRHNALKAC